MPGPERVPGLLTTAATHMVVRRRVAELVLALVLGCSGTALPVAGPWPVPVAQAASLSYARSVGGVGDDEPLALAVDETGNVYLTGFFNGTVDFDPGPGVLSLTSTPAGNGTGGE